MYVDFEEEISQEPRHNLGKVCEKVYGLWWRNRIRFIFNKRHYTMVNKLGYMYEQAEKLNGERIWLAKMLVVCGFPQATAEILSGCVHFEVKQTKETRLHIYKIEWTICKNCIFLR